MTWTTADIGDLTGRVALVTGATSGLGKQCARELTRCGATVVLAGRDVTSLAAAASEVGSAQTLVVDFVSLASVAAAAAQFRERFERLDLLLNNAGMQTFQHGVTIDGIEHHLGVNYVGAFVLTTALLPMLTATPHARVTSVTSYGAKFGDPTQPFDEWFEATPESDSFRHRFGYSKLAYGNSKVALELFTHALNEHFRTAGFTATATAAHPGTVPTNLLRHWSPWVSAGFNQLSLWIRSAHPVERGALPLLRALTDPDPAVDQIYAPAGPIKEMAGPPTLFPRRPHVAAAIAAGAAQTLWGTTQSRLLKLQP